VGVTKQAIVEMVGILKQAFNVKYKRRGRHVKFPVEMLFMVVFEYWC
jgi:hypothetical protein